MEMQKNMGGGYREVMEEERGGVVGTLVCLASI